MFLGFKIIKIEQNLNHKTIDIYINNKPFDIKLSVFPKKLLKKIDTITDKELCVWLYKNQSFGDRKHLKNRLFVVVLDQEDPAKSWKVKRQFDVIRKQINLFMKRPKFIKLDEIKAGVIKVVV